MSDITRDPTAKIVIAAEFDHAEAFQNGLARVVAVGKEAYVRTTGAFLLNPFPGSTLRAEKERNAAAARAEEERVAAEALQAAQTAEGARVANISRVEHGIVGEWAGTFGRHPDARLTIGNDGGVLVGFLLCDGWREALKSVCSQTAGWS